MSDGILQRLSGLKPNAGHLNRDTLMFEAGRASASRVGGWKTLATMLSVTQALTLAVLLSAHTAPREQQQAAPLVTHEDAGKDQSALATTTPRNTAIWSASTALDEVERQRPDASPAHWLDSEPPLRAGGQLPENLLN